MINKYLTDYERVQLSQLAYQKLAVGQKISLAAQDIGRVERQVHAADGMQAYVLVNDQEAMILYKGSFGIIKGNPQTWRDEWLNTNLPIGLALLAKQKYIPSQLQTAADLLKQVRRDYPQKRLYVYGHSLGAINGQYALASLGDSRQLGAAYLYEGTNIWELLTRKQRRNARRLWPYVFNYVDIYDPVTLGLTPSHHLVGKLQYVDSHKLMPIKQHLFGGYQFDEQGRLRLKQVDAAFLETARAERKLLAKTSKLSRTLIKQMWQLNNKQLELPGLIEFNQLFGLNID